MTQSIVGNPAPQPTPVRAEANAPSANLADAKAWHAAFEHAMAGDFQGWFQPPGSQHSAGSTPRGAATATWAGALARGNENASRASASSAGADAPGHGRATATRHALRSDADRPARDGGDDAASTAGGAPAVPAAAIGQAFETPDSRVHALLSTLAGLTGLQAVPAPDIAAGVESPLAIAPRAGDAASPSAAAAANPGTTEESEPASSAGAPARARPAASTDEREPLRVHAQWSEDGVHLWLGADVGGFAAVNAVTTQLQQALAAQGTRLLRVICNGRDISAPAARDLPGATRFDAQVEAGSPVATDRVVPLSF